MKFVKSADGYLKMLKYDRLEFFSLSEHELNAQNTKCEEPAKEQ